MVDSRSTATPDLPAPARDRLDTAIARLQRGARTWTGLTLDQRARLLDRVHDTVGAAAADWVDGACLLKGLGPDHPLRGEEWLAGPYGTLAALKAYAASLRALAAGHSPVRKRRMHERADGRLAVDAFPRTLTDALLLSGFHGEVWLRPGTTEAQAQARAGLGQLNPAASGGVGLVLGAGNVTSIPLLDALYKLLSANRVALVKLNPTMDSLLPVFERAFAPLIEPGLVEFVTGGGDTGQYLTEHPDIDHVHITGAEATFDTIVWGPRGSARTRRKNSARPLLRKPITAELGGVSPIIVVPGAWTDADLRFQAEHVATMRLQNSGHNCIAGQVVVLSRDWPQRDAFLAHLRDVYASAPERPIWYPHATERLTDAARTLPDAEVYAGGSRVLVVEQATDAPNPTPIESTEYFAPVLGVIELDGTGQGFLDAAIAYANERLAGTLGANVLIDPDTERDLGGGFDRAIADLHYGSIAINTWTAAVFLTPTLTWGAYPGSTPESVGSGLGIVHNAFLLDDVERSVMRGPFRPFPRALTGRERTVLPKPPWFITARTGAAVSEGLTRYLIDRNPLGLAATFARAFRA